MVKSLLYSPMYFDDMLDFPDKQAIRTGIFYSDKLKIFTHEYYADFKGKDNSALPVMSLDSSYEKDDIADFMEAVVSEKLEFIIPKNYFDKNSKNQDALVTELIKGVELLSEFDDLKTEYVVQPLSLFDFYGVDKIMNEYDKDLNINPMGFIYNEKQNSYKPNTAAIVVRKDFTLLLYSLIINQFNLNKKEYNVPFNFGNSYLDYNISTKFKRRNALNLLLSNCLPIPHANNSIMGIVKFKEKRISEYLRFQELITEMENSIGNVEDLDELQSVLYSESIKLKLGLKDLERTLKEGKVQYALGALENILNLDTPNLINTVVASGVVGATVNPVLGVATGMAYLSVKSILDHKSRKQKANQNSLSFLFHATSKKIIK